MNAFFRSRSTFAVVGVGIVLMLFVLAGCSGSDGATGATGAPGQDASFANSSCAACHHMSDAVLSKDLPIYASGLAGGAKTVTAGTPTLLTAVPSKLPSGVSALGYYWYYSSGLAATITTPVTVQSVTVTVTAGQDYRATLVANEQLPDRTMVVPVNALAKELAAGAEVTVLAFGDDGKLYWDTAVLTDGANDVDDYAPVDSPGINNVPVNVPVLVKAVSTWGGTWTLGTPGGAAALDDVNSAIAYFTPDVAGHYTVNDGVNTIDIYAGTWVGAITGVNASGRPLAANCTGCHDDVTAPNKFAEWMDTGHAEIFTNNLNAGGHYSSSCFPCHTVGFNTAPTASNNGFDDQPGYATFSTSTFYFSSSTNNARYSTMLTEYPELAQESNIQCENCHGPNGSSLHNDGTFNDERISLSADVCAACHGEPLRHARFQQWQESGHANFSLAESRGSREDCGVCHSAQGFLLWTDQLLNGNPLHTLPSASVTWTASTVQPQTCATCHDPHAEGTTTESGPAYSDATVQTNAEPRITGDTPKLPAGFAALGVGKGAVCMICHNTRNGGYGLTAADGSLSTPAGAPFAAGAYLHEDYDPVFGNDATEVDDVTGVKPGTPAYDTPHSAAQGDVLMGHNAYFVGYTGGNLSTYRSPHSTSIVVDTCVTCHMEKTPAPAELSNNYGGTNHTFKASMEICVDCHSVENLGAKLQMDVQGMLDQLKDAIGGAIITQQTFTTQRISSISFTSGSLKNASLLFTDGTSTTQSVSTLVPLTWDNDHTLQKAIWNYNLIRNDSSLGVHNPNFVRDVLGNTYSKVRALE